MNNLVNKNIDYLNSIEKFDKSYVIVIKAYGLEVTHTYLEGTKSVQVESISYTFPDNIKYIEAGDLGAMQLSIMTMYDIEKSFKDIDQDLETTGTHRYFDILKAGNFINTLDYIKDRLVELANELEPAYRQEGNIRYFTHGVCEKYLILDTQDSEHYSQVMNDNQCEALLALQVVLEEKAIKQNSLSPHELLVIAPAIPGYFRIRF